VAADAVLGLRLEHGLTHASRAGLNTEEAPAVTPARQLDPWETLDLGVCIFCSPESGAGL